METKDRKTWDMYNVVPVAILLMGLMLLVYMITVEDEPGALPLLLILAGTAALVIRRFKKKKPTS